MPDAYETPRDESGLEDSLFLPPGEDPDESESESDESEPAPSDTDEDDS